MGWGTKDGFSKRQGLKLGLGGYLRSRLLVKEETIQGVKWTQNECGKAGEELQATCAVGTEKWEREKERMGRRRKGGGVRCKRASVK